MKRTPASSLLVSIVCCLLCGCGYRLSKHAAASVLESQFKRTPDGKLYPAPGGMIDFEVGDIQGIGIDKNCNDESSRPYKFNELGQYQQAGLIKISRPASCLWHVSLTSLGLRSVTGTEDRQAALSGQSKFVIIYLGYLNGFEAKRIEQDGPHAIADVLMKFDFTEAMRSLSQNGIYPDLDDAGIWKWPCKYDLPSAQIQCEGSIPLAYVDKKWVIDPSNLKAK